ncbi:MAG: hypothetical protein ISR40_06280 [Puniceicoccaceae bacterium]|nr:hypothetical protein [Puniceicoccaceae bacterium]
MKKTSLTILALLTTVASLASAFSITGQEIGTDVVFTYTGSINTGDLSFSGTGLLDTEFEAIDNEFAAGGNADVYVFANLTVTGAMGTGGDVPGVAAGDTIGIFPNFGPGGIEPNIWLPSGYTSGDNITGTITFTNNTFAAMGVTENNTVTYSWGSGGNADSITFSTVPEPSSSALWLGIATVVVAITRRRWS